jgi:hypothetical protein
LFFGLFAAPLMLASSAALAAPGADACNNIELVATGQCDFEVSGGCTADCTPINFVAACDGKCTASADVTCTGGCEASCMEDCQVNPGSFDCTGSCTTSCEAGCTGRCSDSGCLTDCKASCSNRCQVQCSATPPSATCDVQCKASCDASCQVQANVDCHVSCTADIQGGCTAACDTPRGALFCNGQYVDVPGNVDDCLAYLENLGLTVTAECSVTAGGSECSASIGCSAANTLGDGKNGLGAGAIAGLVMGLGLAVSRRRRKS